MLEETGEYRLIKHSFGEVRVPLQPQRVVTLQDQNALLPLFELGFTNVVGSVGRTGEDGNPVFRRMQDYDTSAITVVGEVGNPNLEQIALLRPDLILGNEYEVTAENYELLSQIAPTIVITRGQRSVFAIASDFALLVNRQAELAALEARYQARVAEVALLRQERGLETASLIIFLEDGRMLVEAAGAPTQLLRDLGFTRPAPQQNVLTSGENGFFSVEALTDHDADLFLWPYFGDPENDRAQTLRASPLWQQLEAVQQDRARSVDGARWYGAAYQPLLNALDDLEQLLNGL